MDCSGSKPGSHKFQHRKLGEDKNLRARERRNATLQRSLMIAAKALAGRPAPFNAANALSAIWSYPGRAGRPYVAAQEPARR